ncbi:hypothetical protein [Planctomicrobium sp. SH527]|uniref:hypothetical protein n=1 Tax=Planctomicrobium sp. SH527 TaxID=3448123 RepID=UPI003F5BEA25
MATVIHAGPEIDFGGSLGQSETRNQSYLLHVSVPEEDRLDTAVDAVYAYFGGRGAPHPTKPGLFVNTIDVSSGAKGQNRDGYYLLRASVNYTSNQYEATKTEQQVQVQAENPLDDPIQWRSSFRTEMVVAETDIHGNAILNSAGDDHDPKPMRKKILWTHACTKNVASVPVALTSYAEAVNSDSITIRGIPCDPETVQITGIDIPDVQERNGISFVPLTIVYEIDEDGFDLSLLSMGYREKVTAGGELRDIYIKPSDDALAEDPDLKPQRTSVPVMLDEDGVWIEAPTPSTVHYTEHEITHKMAFAGLPGVA